MTLRRPIKLIVLASLVGLAALAFYLVHASALSSALTIQVAPSDSVVVLDGKSIRQGTLHLKPGSHTVKVSRSGFAGDSRTVITSKHNTKYLGIALLSNSANTADWYLTHQADRKLAEGISSNNFDASSKQQVTDMPFILKLPFLGPGLEFKINYGAPVAGSNGKPVIYIQADSDAAKQDALTWITHQGFDPSKMYIVYSSL